MKQWITLGVGCLLSMSMQAMAAAPVIPTLPSTCQAKIDENGYCADTKVENGQIVSRLFIVVDKASFPTAEDLMNRYLDFGAWGSYVASSGSDAILFNKTIRMADQATADGRLIARHYYDYKLKVPLLPGGYQRVRGVSTNERMADADLSPGVIGSIKFAALTSGPQEVPAGEPALNGAEGVKMQTGYIHALDCSATTACADADNQWYVIYETNIIPGVNILLGLSAPYIQSGLEAVLSGMLFE